MSEQTWQTFDTAIPELGRAVMILRRGAWREPRFVADVGTMIEYEDWWELAWRYATAVEIAGRV